VVSEASEESQESALGRELHQTIVSRFHVYTEPRLNGYVNRVGRSVARPAERQDLLYRFTILYDDRVYATAVPGGFIYITTGFLNFLENEAELAGILAHEVGELQIKDARLSKSKQAVNRMVETGMLVAPMFGQIGGLAAVGLILVGAIAGAREIEPEKRVRRADKLALRYLSASGHDPQGYLNVIARLAGDAFRESVYTYDYFLSRPMDRERYRRLIEEFEEIPMREGDYPVRRARFLEMTRGVREIYR
jgi:predicted Zn-dependent protease